MLGRDSSSVMEALTCPAFHQASPALVARPESSSMVTRRSVVPSGQSIRSVRVAARRTTANAEPAAYPQWSVR